MNIKEAGKVLSALQLLNQLINPQDEHPVLVKWRVEINEAIALQEYEYALRQRNLEPQHE